MLSHDQGVDRKWLGGSGVLDAVQERPIYTEDAI